MPDGEVLHEPLQVHDAGTGAERILAELAALAADVRHIRATLDARGERLPLPRVQLRIVEPLAEQVSSAVGDLVWRCADLFDYARRDSDLRAGIITAIGALDTGATRRLGRLLGRAEGVALPNRHRVERVDDGPADCSSWRIIRI